ncbi:hypothetical protein [Methanobrevibacter sp.]|nr:hypothetical protein [Methanobrevibacter sp.]MEE1335156.1 hypothetical protein [Methanobrevibacter sp.]
MNLMKQNWKTVAVAVVENIATAIRYTAQIVDLAIIQNLKKNLNL